MHADPFAVFSQDLDLRNANRRITPEDLRNLSQFNIFVNQVEGNPVTSGSFYLDDIRAG